MEQLCEFVDFEDVGVLQFIQCKDSVYIITGALISSKHSSSGAQSCYY